MEAVIGLIVVCVLLFVWLSGHWMARALVFIGLSSLAVMCSLVLATDQGGGGKAVVWLLGIPIAWVIASIPSYYQRRRYRY